MTPCAADDEDNLIVTTLPGICFEIGATYADPDWHHAPIVAMYVFPSEPCDVLASSRRRESQGFLAECVVVSPPFRSLP